MTWRDRTALVIAAGLISWGIIAIAFVGWHGKSFTDSGGEILLAIAGGLSASLATYFATKENGPK